MLNRYGSASRLSQPMRLGLVSALSYKLIMVARKSPSCRGPCMLSNTSMNRACIELRSSYHDSNNASSVWPLSRFFMASSARIWNPGATGNVSALRSTILLESASIVLICTVGRSFKATENTVCAWWQSCRIVRASSLSSPPN